MDGRQYVALASVPMRATMEERQAETEVAAAAPAPNKNVKPSAKKAQVAAARPQDHEAAFQKVLAKELAPTPTLLPPSAAKPLPALQATPVSAEVAR